MRCPSQHTDIFIRRDRRDFLNITGDESMAPRYRATTDSEEKRYGPPTKAAAELRKDFTADIKFHQEISRTATELPSLREIPRIYTMNNYFSAEE